MLFLKEQYISIHVQRQSRDRLRIRTALLFFSKFSRRQKNLIMLFRRILVQSRNCSNVQKIYSDIILLTYIILNVSSLLENIELKINSSKMVKTKFSIWKNMLMMDNLANIRGDKNTYRNLSNKLLKLSQTYTYHISIHIKKMQFVVCLSIYLSPFYKGNKTIPENVQCRISRSFSLSRLVKRWEEVRNVCKN